MTPTSKTSPACVWRTGWTEIAQPGPSDNKATIAALGQALRINPGFGAALQLRAMLSR